MTSNQDYRLLDPDGQTPNEVIGVGDNFKLPLPEQDREELESRLRQRQFKRISLSELMVATTAVCLIFAVSTWVRLEILSAILGVIVLVTATVAKFAKLNSRTTILYLVILLCGYLASVVAALLHVNQG